MKTSIKILLISGFLLLNIGCQKDDICPAAVETTPSLNVSFFDFENKDQAKIPVNLSVKAGGMSQNLYYRVEASEISIPLRTDTDINVTQYSFQINAPDSTATTPDDISNTDVINFSYTKNLVYINRACSYRVEFVGLNASFATEDTDANHWIKELKVDQTTKNDTIPHISIYF